MTMPRPLRARRLRNVVVRPLPAGRWCSIGLGALGATLLLGATAEGQSLRDDVKQHVDDNLSNKPAPAKKHKKHHGGGHRRRTHTSNSAFDSSDFEDDEEIDEEEEEEEGPSLPIRLWSGKFELDASIGAGYRGWYPEQFQNVGVEMRNYFTWNVEVRGRFFGVISLHRGYYESNALAGPVHRGQSIAADVGSHVPKAAWALGMLGFPLLKIWEPVIRYESRSFETKARPGRPVCVVARDAPDDLTGCPRSSAPLDFISGYESFAAGIRYHADKDPTPLVRTPHGGAPPLFFGLGYTSYAKPYQLTLDGNTLDEYLFSSRFRGGGVAFGTSLGGGVDRFYLDIDAQAGLGQVSLTESLTLNELAPSGWLITYLQSQASVGYRWALFHGFPTVMIVPSLSANGIGFLFVPTKKKEGERYDVDAINYDLFWLAQASLVVPM